MPRGSAEVGGGEAWALSHTAEQARVAGWLEGTPWRLLATLLAVLTVTSVGAFAGLVPGVVLRATAATCVHGALMAVALGWCGVERAAVRQPLAVLLIAAGFSGAALGGVAVLAHLLTPAWLAALARRGALRPLGLGPSVPGVQLAVGAALGACLGAHVVATATLTLGYGLGVGGVERFVAGAAYDIGVNVLTAECFFRGALFDRLHRRRPVAIAALVATAASVARYLADPLLSGAVEVLVGAVFYLALLGLGTCWLRWWSASVVPGMVAGVLFFAAYRLIGPR